MCAVEPDGYPLIEAVIRADKKRWEILGYVRDLHLADCWVGAGFVRNAVWDHLHDNTWSTDEDDVDVIWFDALKNDVEADRQVELQLSTFCSSTNWSVKNQARMHVRNGDRAYSSATDAMRFWPETATAVAVRRDDHDRLVVSAPYGLADLTSLIARPTPYFNGPRLPIYLGRIQEKQWRLRWPNLKILHCEANL
jgi:uncharacterized protein